MCKKQFRTKGIRDTGTREEEADTVYLLAKKLPHTLVSGENEKFKEELAKTEAKDIVAFAQAVGQQAKEIDGKVCKNDSEGQNDWKCNTGSNSTHKLSTRFASEGAADPAKGGKWPNGATGTVGSAQDVARDLNALPRDDKAKVAGLLSKTVSGAEVVEIRAVSTTSVMLNACYDLQSEGFSAWTIRFNFRCTGTCRGICTR